ALLVASALPPPVLLAALQGIETGLGRRRFQRWGARRLDIDIILWSGGRWCSRDLIIPHPAFAQRDFVLRSHPTGNARLPGRACGICMRFCEKRPIIVPQEVDQPPARH
ncbi:2-amino-4-hydroxy-6-hydroxymethyldihydropteridine diphosphokinase, partial [Sphingobium yanoikuyae]|uniref:2-amino-4-hydroxy-6- hydroxymethyldihydropteridine diphosphokinase n=1 Tax=Sphingobium yanoikuyae TaxID=13690 RepID=UPI0035E4261F